MSEFSLRNIAFCGKYPCIQMEENICDKLNSITTKTWEQMFLNTVIRLQLRFADEIKTTNDQNFSFFKCPSTEFSVNRYVCSMDSNVTANNSICVNRCGVSSCRGKLDTYDSNFVMFGGFYLALGCLAIVGNVVVTFEKLKTLYAKKQTLSKVEKAYQTMVLSLSIADFCMGIYCLTLGIVGINFVRKPYDAADKSKWLASSTCISLGLINFISSQVSVSTLVVISFFRLFCACHPFKTIPSKAIAGSLIVFWTIWIAISLIPILPSTATIFSRGRRIPLCDNDLAVNQMECVFNQIRLNINKRCNFRQERTATFDQLWNETVTNENFSNLSETHDYYNHQSICTMRYLVGENDKANVFTIPILAFNLLAFFCILVSHVGIYFITVWKTSKMRGKRISQSFQTNIPHQQSRENKEIRRRMCLIIATDFCCWMPVIVTSLLYFFSSFGQSECKLQEKRQTLRQWFPYIVVILLPINSVINPLIYSTLLWQSLWKKLFLQFKCNTVE
ncbi:unnamed protein product [Clavelina lepadiformis]|uniref:G-protein coupled receptors family 1 profile domain-containing protein n=1 Tax=Clavelina lepadiformis TaxID=159417 RepID=A0ABP0GC09_CLALP